MQPENAPRGGTKPTPARPDDSACTHRVAESADWPWLPHRQNGTLTVHPYCRECGLIRSVGTDRPLDMGGLSNLVSGLQHIVSHDAKKITEAQKRLILRTCSREGLDDTYGFDRAAQLSHFTQIVSHYTGIKADVVANHLHHC